MLTRLRVKGFKNLVEVDVRFGPFTCIAGLNGVGKSNLFDAILFLGARAPTMLEMLRDLTVDRDAAAGADNPLGQVTAHPVVALVAEETVMFAEPCPRAARVAP